MTREQAIEVLISRYNSGVIRSRTNDDEWRLATDTVIVALRGSQPDPDFEYDRRLELRDEFHGADLTREDIHLGSGLLEDE